MATAKYGVPFADLSDADRTDFVNGANTTGGFDDIEWEFDQAGISGQRTLVSIIAQCYYRDDRVMRSLEMEPRSPFPQGFEVEQGDWSLLDPVKRRAAGYIGRFSGADGHLGTVPRGMRAGRPRSQRTWWQRYNPGRLTR